MIIHVDMGETSAEPISARDEFERTVEQPLVLGLQSPVVAEPTPRSRTPNAGTSDCGHITIPVSFGGQTLSLACTENALWGYVTAAWLQGGFITVVRAREALQAAISKAITTRYDNEHTAAEARKRLDRAESVTQPDRSEASRAEQWRGFSRKADDDARASRGTAACAQRYAELFRDVWRNLALAEEVLLKDYETLAVQELTDIAGKNEATAAAQWKKYGCYLKGDAGRKLVSIIGARDNVADIRLALDDTKLKELYNTALDLRQRAADIASDTRALDPAVEAARRRGDDPVEQRRLRGLAIDDRVKKWGELREKMGIDDPALLQVYPRMSPRTLLPEFRLMIVEGLLDVFEESSRIVKDMIWLLGEESLRIEPRSEQGVPAVRSAYGDSAEAIDRGDYWDALQKYQLTLPASVAIADKLRNANVARDSAWLHGPVRIAVANRVRNDSRRSRFNQQGSFEYAAIVHLWDAVEDLRVKQATSRGHRGLLIFAAALVLAPFTGGGSLVAAGLVQTAFCAEEIDEATGAFTDADKLARSTLAPTEMALWTRPSTLSLVRLVTARSLDVAGSAIPAGRIPLVIDLAMVAASMAVDPRAR